MNQNQAWIDQYKAELGTRESVSGYGSELVNTIEIRQALPDIFRSYGVHSVIDMPCGDWNWMSKVDLTGINYTGLDIVPEMVERNTELYGPFFHVHDAINDELPYADLLICRDFLFHIPYAQIFKVLENIDKAGIRYLLTTTFPSILNTDVIEDDTIRWRKLNLCAHPFNFPDAEYIIQENNSAACMGRQVCLFRR